MSADTATLSTCLVKMWVRLPTKHHHKRPPTWGRCPAFGVVGKLYRKQQKKAQENNMTLNIKEIQEQGGRLGDMLPRIELVRQLSNSLIMAKNNGADTAILSGQMKEGLAVIRDQMEQLYRELDGIAVYLLNCENFEELGYKSDDNTRHKKNDTNRI